MLFENEISIKRNIIYSIVLTFSQYIFPLIIFPYISRVLGPENIGKIDFVDSFVNYFVLFSSLGINILGIREISKNRNNRIKLNQTFSSLLIIHAIFTLIFFIIYLLLISFYFEKSIYSKLILIGSAKLLFSFLLVEWLYKGLENFKLITIRTIFIKLLSIISIFIFVKNEDDYIIFWLLTVLAIVINSLVNIFLSKRYVRFNFNQIEASPYFKPFVFLGLYLIFTSFYTTFNIIFLGVNSTPEQVGYYTTAVKIYGVILGLYTAITNVMLPRMSFLISTNNRDEFNSIIKKSFNALFTAGIPVLIFSFIFSQEIVKIVAGPDFSDAVPVLQIVLFLIISVGVAQICSVQVLIPLKKDNNILFISIIGATVGIILNFILVKRYQAIGSAYVLMISETIVCILLLFASYQYASIKIPFKEIINNIFAYVPLILLLWLSKTFINIHFIWELLLSGIVTIIYLVSIQYYVLKNTTVIHLLHKYILK